MSNYNNIINLDDKIDYVAYDNDLYMLNLSGLSSLELNLFFSLICKMKDKGNSLLVFDSAEVKNFFGSSNRGNVRILDILTRFRENIFKLDFTQVKKLPNNKKYIGIYNIFEVLEIIFDEKTNSLETLKIKSSEIFTYLVNNLESEYTTFELDIFKKFQKTYSKHLFRLLKRFQDTGFFVSDIDKLKSYLGLENTNTRDFNKILKQSIDELKEIEIIYNNKTEKLFSYLDIVFIKNKKDRRKYSHIKCIFNIMNCYKKSITNKKVSSIDASVTNYNDLLLNFFKKNRIFIRHPSKQNIFYEFLDYNKNLKIYNFEEYLFSDLFGLTKTDKQISFAIGNSKDFESHKDLYSFLIKNAYTLTQVEQLNDSLSIPSKLKKEKIRLITSFFAGIENID